jgi:hypothetical protein
MRFSTGTALTLVLILSLSKDEDHALRRPARPRAMVRPAGRPLCFNAPHLLGLGAGLASPDADTIRSVLAETGEGEEP